MNQRVILAVKYEKESNDRKEYLRLAVFLFDKWFCKDIDELGQMFKMFGHFGCKDHIYDALT